MTVPKELTVRVHPNLDVLLIPDLPQTRPLFPHAPRVTTPNGFNVLSAHFNEDNVRALRQLGQDVPTPLEKNGWTGESYPGTTISVLGHQGKRSPWPQQLRAAGTLSLYERCYLLSELGCGKTLATLLAASWLQRSKQVRRVLIVADGMIPELEWIPTVRKQLRQKTVQLQGTAVARRSKLQSGVAYNFINYAGLHIIAPMIADGTVDDIDLVVFDEVSAFKNYLNAKRRFKAAEKISKAVKYVWGLSGFIMPKSPEDVYGPARIVNPDRVPRSLTRWRHETMLQVGPYKWEPKPDALTQVREALQPCFLATREELEKERQVGPSVSSLSSLGNIKFSLPSSPQQIQHTLSAPRDAKQAEIYKALVNLLTVQLDNHEITAANAGVKVSKLLQISSGFVYGNPDENGVAPTHVIPHLNRLKVLAKCLMAFPKQRFVIFCNYKAGQRLLSCALKRFSYSFEVLNGDVPKQKRADLIRRIQDPASGLSGLVADPRTMSHGLNLNEARVFFWWNPPPSAETWKQANARNIRPGQTKQTYVFKFIQTPAEQVRYAALKRSASQFQQLKDMIKTGV